MSMDIYTAPGSKIVFANPTAGYPGDGPIARSNLQVGETYTVRTIERHSSISYVFLAESAGIGYNTVLFDNKE